MTPPTTIEFQRQVHEDRTALLQSSMHRPSSFRPRRTLGAWMVSTGLRLAPEERMHPRLRAGADPPRPPRVRGPHPFLPSGSGLAPGRVPSSESRWSRSSSSAIPSPASRASVS